MRLSWTEELYNVYERNCGNPDSGLLPLYHSTAKAQITVKLREDGTFAGAYPLSSPKKKAGKSEDDEPVIDETVTVIPVTEDSAARSSGISPHPFADKLIYTAGDYGKYFGDGGKDSGKYFESYISGLREWAESEHSHRSVRAVLAYLEKGNLIGDLMECRVFEKDEATGKPRAGEKIDGIALSDCFVRFRVDYDDGQAAETWKDVSLYDSFIAYNSSREQERQLCYATGKVLPVTYKHPSKIRNAGDKGKLISANDESGFSYRGRFQNKEQAVSVSYEFSQKMHNGLKWIIEKQGVSIGGSLELVVWESAMREMPDVTEGMFFDEPEEMFADPYEEYKAELRRSIFGNRNELACDKDSKAMVLGLDSATTGRLSIVIYSELRSSEFLKNVEKWHRDTAWFYYSGKEKRYKVSSFPMADIIRYAFGTEQGNFIECSPKKLVAHYACRLIPCITEGRSIPGDIVRALVNRASCPLKYDNYFNWQRVLGAACGMLRKLKLENLKHENEEECTMALDENCFDRDYLYGRLLAVADAAENASYDRDDKRTTNAKRYFEAFSNRPYTTWAIIRKRLEPYLEKLGDGQRIYYENLIHEITDKFQREDFAKNTKLEPEYLHGYSCQMRAIYSKKEKAPDGQNS